jgi:hypothetical protein
MHAYATQPRVRLTSNPFEGIAPRYVENAEQRRIASGGRSVRRMLRGGPHLSAYDEFMLLFHDYLKGNAEFQSGAPKYRLEFQPGWALIVFTDVAPHAGESGRHALEQTLIVARNSLARPGRAPISILEKLADSTLA